MVFTINNSPLAGQDGQIRHEPAPARLGYFASWNQTWPCGWTRRATRTRSPFRSRHVAPVDSDRERCAAKATNCRSASRRSSKKRSTERWHEPFEILVVDVPSADVGPVMEQVGARRGQILEMITNETGMSHLEFSIPARGLIGLRTRLLNATAARRSFIIATSPTSRFRETCLCARTACSSRKRRAKWSRSRWASFRSGLRCSSLRATMFTKG